MRHARILVAAAGVNRPPFYDHTSGAISATSGRDRAASAILDRSGASRIMKSVFTAALWLLTQTCFAQSVWLSPGAVSWHADRAAGYNERNSGPGLEWRSESGEIRAAAGQYRNSIRQDTRYATVGWFPLRTDLGPVRIAAGGAIGIADGYRVNQGRAFPVALPALSVEVWRIGLNVTAWPRLEKGESAGVAVQLLIRIWEGQ